LFSVAVKPYVPATFTTIPSANFASKVRAEQWSMTVIKGQG
jgi:hypothetical protein